MLLCKTPFQNGKSHLKGLQVNIQLRQQTYLLMGSQHRCELLFVVGVDIYLKLSGKGPKMGMKLILTRHGKGRGGTPMEGIVKHKNKKQRNLSRKAASFTIDSFYNDGNYLFGDVLRLKIR